MNNSFTFVVPEALLCNNSAFFAGCMSHPCKENTFRVIELPDIKPETFAVYLRFLITGRMYIIEDEVEEKPKEGEENTESTDPTSPLGRYIPFARNQPGRPSILNPKAPPAAPAAPEAPQNMDQTSSSSWSKQLSRCFSTYRLATHLDSPTFKDAITDSIIEIVTEHLAQQSHHKDYNFLNLDSVEYLYTYSEPDACVRDLVVDWAVCAIESTGMDERRGLRGYEGIIGGEEFVKKVKKRVRGDEWRDPFKGSGMVGCKYHEHRRKGGRCYREAWVDE